MSRTYLVTVVLDTEARFYSVAFLSQILPSVTYILLPHVVPFLSSFSMGTKKSFMKFVLVITIPYCSFNIFLIYKRIEQFTYIPHGTRFGFLYT